MLPPLIVIIGPTAVGKSQLALALAEEFGGEIVSADSRQVYRYMDIGTAKPTPAERARLPHHLIDVVDPDQPYTLALYQQQAYAAIADVTGRGRLPLLVGGTGLYVQAVVEGLRLPHVAPDAALRQALADEARQKGGEWLYAEVQGVDPVTAERERLNPRRLIRALEVYRATGIPISQRQHREPPPYRLLQLGLTLDRPELYRRIDARVERMIEQGLVDEVRSLVARGYGYDLPAMSGLGYRQIGEYLRGEVDLPTAMQRIKYQTHAFVRHQAKWFRLDDPRIHRLPADAAVLAQARRILAEFLNPVA